MWQKVLELDKAIYLLINNLPHPKALVYSFRLFDYLTYGGVAGFILFGFIYLTSGKKGKKLAAGAFLTIIFTILFNELLIKSILVRRARPFNTLNANLWAIPPGNMSFPSGQTAGAFALFVFLSAFLKNKFFSIVGLILCLMVGLGRVYLGAHYPLDVLGGVVVGTFIGVFVRKLFPSRLEQ